MSLIAFHRVLIGFGIAFCVAFAAWQLIAWWLAGGWGAFALGCTFLLFGALLAVYLRRLKHYVGYEDERG